ncbi:MAG: sugar ABC transporter permease [Clostridiales bacterium]|nr:sugar ABC transporter permease [Clostridiales bacterium]
MTTWAKPRTKKENRIRVKRGPLEKKEARAGLLFVLPWLIGAAVFLAYPLGMSLWYSLNNIRLTSEGMKFTFLAQGNFTQILLSDPDFLPELVDYLLSTVISVPVIVVFAMMIALMLNEKIRGKGFFRLVFFLPVIIVSGPILASLTEQNASTISVIDSQAVTAAISAFLPSIIAAPISELFSNMVTILWYSGVPILIFLSALQKIDRSQYEAAYVDGASGWEMFWKITLPSLKPMILLNCVYTIVFVSSNDQNKLIGLIKSAMFSGTSEKGYGYASAMAWIYSLVVLLLVGLFALIFTARKDRYEREAKKLDRRAKAERRQVLKIQRRQARHAKKYHHAPVR